MVGKSRRSALPLFSLIDSKIPAVKLVPVESVHGLFRGLLLLKLHEGESSGASGIAFGRQENIPNLTHFREESFELTSRRIEAHVSDK